MQGAGLGPSSAVRDFAGPAGVFSTSFLGRSGRSSRPRRPWCSTRSVPPGDFPPVSTYRGLTVLFALGDENADARIEQLIAEHSNPKTLTVVSSDNRIRLAASRRRARALTADEFWQVIDDAEGRSQTERGRQRRSPALRNRRRRPSARSTKLSTGWEFSATWINAPEMRQAHSPSQSLLTDAELEEIKREIDREP